jgi:hypothetical protein
LKYEGQLVTGAGADRYVSNVYLCSTQLRLYEFYLPLQNQIYCVAHH